MATHYKFIIKEEGKLSKDDEEQLKYIHCQNFFGTPDAMLCGKVFEGDCEFKSINGGGSLQVVQTDEKITCPDCISIIQKCKSAKASEFNVKIEKRIGE